MFRKRFDGCFPRSLPHFGPIEFERDIQQDPPAERVEQFLCVVLGLLLNRKQDIKSVHHRPFQSQLISLGTFADLVRTEVNGYTSRSIPKAHISSPWPGAYGEARRGGPRDPPQIMSWSLTLTPHQMLIHDLSRVGHYHKALNEDAINGQSFKIQWPTHWTESPLARGGTFQTLTPERRVDLLKTLTLWALGHSEAIKAFITASYTGKRTNDDLNQPLSVQPWGFDSDKRRYFLVEGDDNCSFRVYRESNPAALYNRQWISVAGSIDEVKALADKLATADGGPNARKLSTNIMKNIANFEEKEEKRKRREYRRQQKERFRRPEPGLFSMYEGRTRGKRVKYTYSEDEDFYTDSTNRRSTRNTRNHSPIEAGPVVTASGRQSRPPARLNADTLSNGDDSVAPSVQGDAMDMEMSEAPDLGRNGRPRRSAAANGWAYSRKRRRNVLSDDEDEENDESEPDLGKDEEDHIPQDDTDDEEEFENDAMDEDDQDVAADSPGSNDSRVVKLPIKVKIDRNGKVKRMLNDADTPSASTPSNIASSPSAADDLSEDSPSEIPDYEPEPIQDVVNVVPLKHSEPKPALFQPSAVAGTNGNSKPQLPASSADFTAAAASTDPPLTVLSATSGNLPVPAPTGTVSPSYGVPSKLSTVTTPGPSSSGEISKKGPTSELDVSVTTGSKVHSSAVAPAPSTPLGGTPASLAFRGSPEKSQAPPRPVLATGIRD